MQLPADLREAVEQLLLQTSQGELSQASQKLSQRYRAEIRDGKMHLGNTQSALAYLAARLPATYAAMSHCLSELDELLVDFKPKTHLDVGAGPGTAAFAAQNIFSSIQQTLLFEQSPDISALGQILTKQLIKSDVKWLQADVSELSTDRIKAADLVTLGYVLDELSPAEQDCLIDDLWQKTSSVLLLVEPGTPAGWQRLMRQRQRLLGKGAALLAPCPHFLPCPLKQTDWCHFSVRVERSRIHRLTKKAEVPFEDEKYSYLIFSRQHIGEDYERILTVPKRSSGKVILKVCTTEGKEIEKTLTKRDGDTFSKARRSGWGVRI